MLSSSVNIANMQEFSKSLRKNVADIETFLLDWDRYKSTDLLGKLYKLSFEIYETAKNAQATPAANLSKAFSDVFEFAQKGEITLTVEDVDVLLRANDIFSGISEFTVRELVEVVTNETSIFDECARAVKKITSPYRIKRYSQEEKPKNGATKPEIKPEEKSFAFKFSEPELKPIPENNSLVLEKFRFELVKSAQTIDKALNSFERERTIKALLPAAEAVSAIKNAAEKVGASQAAVLADGLNAYLNKAGQGSENIDAEKLRTLYEANDIFKKIAIKAIIDNDLPINSALDNLLKSKDNTKAEDNDKVAYANVSTALALNINRGEINKNLVILERNLANYTGNTGEESEKIIDILDIIKEFAIKINSGHIIELASLLLNYIRAINTGQIVIGFSDIQVLKQAGELIKKINNDSGDEYFEEELAIQMESYAQHLTINAPIEKENVELVSQAPTIAIEKFRFDLVKNSKTIDKVLFEFTKDTSPKALENAVQALVAIRLSAGKIGAGAAMDLASSMEEYLNLAANGVIGVDTEKLKTLIAANNTFKKIAEESTLELLDKLHSFNEQIDSYTGSLDSFLHDPESNANAEELVIKPINAKGADVDELNAMTQIAIENITRLSEAKNLEKTLDHIKKELMELHIRIDSLTYSLSSHEDRSLYSKARISGQSVGELINKVDESKTDFSEKLGVIMQGSKELYEDLYSKRSVRFEECLLGLKDFASKLGEAADKKIKIGVRGASIPIGAEILPAIESALPLILKKIIMQSIETPDERIECGKSPVAKIIFTAERRGDSLLIEVSDDGRGEKIGAGDVEVKNVYDRIKTVNGKLEAIAGENIGGKYKMTFPIRYSIINCLLLRIKDNLYAAPIAAVEELTKVGEFTSGNSNTEKSNFKIVQAGKILELEKITNILNEESPAIIIGDYDSKLVLVFDEFIGSAEIAPLDRSEFIDNIPFVLAGAIYQDRPIFILDLEKLKRSAFTDL